MFSTGFLHLQIFFLYLSLSYSFCFTHSDIFRLLGLDRMVINKCKVLVFHIFSASGGVINYTCGGSGMSKRRKLLLERKIIMDKRLVPLIQIFFFTPLIIFEYKNIQVIVVDRFPFDSWIRVRLMTGIPYCLISHNISFDPLDEIMEELKTDSFFHLIYRIHNHIFWFPPILTL